MRLRQFADGRHESPEESLRAFAEMELVEVSQEAKQTPPASSLPHNLPDTIDEYPDPWEGFHGVFQSPYPDLTSNHDYYIAAEASDPHNPPEQLGESDEQH